MPKKIARRTGLQTIAHARDPKQLQHMKESADRGVCPLCELDPKVNKPRDRLRTGTHWIVMRNAFGYRAHKHHILILPKKHITEVAGITPTMWKEFGVLSDWVIKSLRIKGAGIVLRFGDPKLSGSTISHLHFHIQVPDKKRFAIGIFYKDPDLEKFLRWADRKYDQKKKAEKAAKRLKKKK
jgi:diadenosine tetraphosphate (Ap4A) HIT family hydrolase